MQEKQIGKLLKEKDLLGASVLCSEYKGKKYAEDCKRAIETAEQEVNQILSQKRELPFFKLMVDEEKKQKIQDLLKKNVYLGIKYRKLWNEIVDRD
jgi:Mg/Co/Ni transporter MgtE